MSGPGLERRFANVASGVKADTARARELLAMPQPQGTPDDDAGPDDPATTSHPCPCCGGRMRIIETFKRGESPHHRPSPNPLVIRIDTS
jgi:hypothetical protein